MYAGGAVIYRSKTQSPTALSLTEAEFIAAVIAAKSAKYIQSVLTKLGFEEGFEEGAEEGFRLMPSHRRGAA